MHHQAPVKRAEFGFQFGQDGLLVFGDDGVVERRMEAGQKHGFRALQRGDVVDGLGLVRLQQRRQFLFGAPQQASGTFQRVSFHISRGPALGRVGHAAVHLMKSAVVYDFKGKFVANGRFDDVRCMFCTQTLDLFDAAGCEHMDPETLSMAVHALQDEFDGSPLHQCSDRARNVFSLDANAIRQTPLCLLDRFGPSSCGVHMSQVKHHAVQHWERLRCISHRVKSWLVHRNLPPFRL